MTFLLALCLCLGAICTFVARKIYRYRVMLDRDPEGPPRKTIAIIMPARNITVAEVVRGFISYLKRYASFEFDIEKYNIQDQTGRVGECVQRCIDRDVDLIYVLGKRVTEHAVHTMRTSSKRIPIISGGVAVEALDEPIEKFKEVVEITGTVSSYNWEKKINTIFQIYPNLKNILVLNHSIAELTRINMREKNLISSALRRHKANIIMHHVDDISDGCDLNQDTLKEIDLVIISRSSNHLLEQTPLIVQTCARYNVPVFTPEDPIVTNCLFGVKSSIVEEIGRSCGKQALAIFEKNIPTNEIPFSMLNGQETAIINLETPIKSDIHKKLISDSLGSGNYVSVVLHSEDQLN